MQKTEFLSLSETEASVFQDADIFSLHSHQQASSH